MIYYDMRVLVVQLSPDLKNFVSVSKTKIWKKPHKFYQGGLKKVISNKPNWEHTYRLFSN